MTETPRQIVVLGGYGNFGARICRALAADSSLHIVVAARDVHKASQFAAALGSHVTPAAVDTSSTNLAERLAQLNAGLVIHAAGPFQGQDWRVPRAAADAGAHYIDLADGRRWVCDFAAALDESFRCKQLLGVTGASTVPALSSAVIDHLGKSIVHIHSIELCIAPAQQAPRGIATMTAVLSYCGEPIRILRDGNWTDGYGWRHPARVTFTRMQPRLGALCDIPDLELFPQRYPQVKSVMFRAALEVGITQRIFAMLAELRRRKLLPHLSGLAAPLNRLATLFDRFGTPLGGMVVRVSGLDAGGQRLQQAWHIAADNHHGPEIPCMPAILLTRRIVNGELPAIGAHACIGLIPFEEFQPEFARWGMVTDLVTEQWT